MRIEVHTTDRQQFKRCRQRWDFSSNLRGNLETSKPVEPLWFGTGVHLALAQYYEPSSLRSADEALDAFHDYVVNWLNGLDSPAIEDEEWARDLLELGIAVLKNYFLFAEKNDAFDVLWVERVFEVDVPGMPGVSYNFRTDGLVVDRYSRLWLLEHKTAAQLPQGDQEWLMMDDQCGSYLWALHQVPEVQALGRPIEGVLYNSLRKKKPQPLRVLQSGEFSVAKNQDTTFDIAVKQIKEAYGGKVPKNYHAFLHYLRDEKKENFIKREFVRRNPRELELLGESLRHEVLEMVNNPFIYRSPSRINCSGCPFVAPCIAKWEGSDYQAILDGNYKVRTPH